MLRIHTSKEQVYLLIRKMGRYHYEQVGTRWIQRVEPHWLEVMLRHSRTGSHSTSRRRST